MKLPKLKTVLLTPLVLFALFYLIGATIYSQRNEQDIENTHTSATPFDIAIFGASGTAGDGILKAALASPNIDKIHVITRRTTSRIEEGVASGKVEMTIHMDYLDYSEMIVQLSEVDAVFWAIGISAMGVEEKTYGMIHVDFPMRFVEEWNRVSNKPNTSFHFISSSDISENSTTMWIREKIRSEKSLFKLAENSNLRVIAYRPDYIGPTKEEANIGQGILYWFFKPVGAAVRATQIGNAMIEVTTRGNEFKNGSKLSTGKIVAYSDAYKLRVEKPID